MSIASINSFVVTGLKVTPIQIDVHISRGLPQFNIVGLAQTCIKESKYRVKSAIINAGFTFPTTNILVNLAPAHLPKAGTGIELGIAVALLAATQQLPSEKINQYTFFAALGLDGSIGHCPEVAMAYLDQQSNNTTLVTALPQQDLAPYLGLDQIKNMVAITHLKDIVCLLSGEYSPPTNTQQHQTPPPTQTFSIDDIQGHQWAKFFLLVSSAGHHHLLMQGPPGAGKSMLAQGLTSLMPRLSPQASLEKDSQGDQGCKRLRGAKVR